MLFPVYISEWIDFEGLGESLQEISNRANLVKYLIPRLKNDKNGRAPSLILCKTPLTWANFECRQLFAADHIRELIFKLIFLPNVNTVDRFYGILLKVINWCHKASDYRWGTYILSWSIYGLRSVPSHFVCTWLLLLFKLR